MIHNKNKTKNFVIWAAMIAVFVILAGNHIVKSGMFKSELISYEKEVIAEVLESTLGKTVTLEDKIELLKTEVRDKIMKGESAGIVTDEGELFPTFDPYSAILEKCARIGGKMDLDCLSFGPLQFKLSTIILYEKQLNGLDITEMEALVIAHDVELASQLFDEIVYNVEGGIWNWSVAQHDKNYYNTVIPIIRKLIE